MLKISWNGTFGKTLKYSKKSFFSWNWITWKNFQTITNSMFVNDFAKFLPLLRPSFVADPWRPHNNWGSWFGLEIGQLIEPRQKRPHLRLHFRERRPEKKVEEEIRKIYRYIFKYVMGYGTVGESSTVL